MHQKQKDERKYVARSILHSFSETKENLKNISVDIFSTSKQNLTSKHFSDVELIPSRRIRVFGPDNSSWEGKTTRAALKSDVTDLSIRF